MIVVAEGAADAVRDLKLSSKGQDDSGNKLYSDIGVAVKDELIAYCK